MGNGPPTDVVDDEVAARRAEVLERVGANDGPTDDHVQADYFGASQVHVVLLKDGVSTISHKTLMEGEKRDYMNKVNRDLTLNRKTDDAKVRLAPGDDRAELFKLAICDWSIVRDGRPYAFTAQHLNDVLRMFPPDVLDDVEKDIKVKNAWLLADVSIEDLEKEIADLTELLEKKRAEQEGNGDSSS